VLLAEFIAKERLCRPFFAFAIHVERNAGPAWLELTGEAGIYDFSRSELD
jgi:hypothetical protein